jgi:hypothetical protein
MTTNITTGSASGNVVVLEVPAGVEAVIAWITANFQSEVQALFPQYNFTFSTGSSSMPSGSLGNGTMTNGTIGGDNSTNGTIGEGNSTNSTGSNSTDGNSTIGGSNSTVNGSNSTNSTGDNSTSNGTLPSGSGSGSNSTNNASSASYNWTATEYSVPSGCAYADNTNSTVSCSSGNSRGCSFTFAELNEFWDFSAVSSCSDAQSVLASCLANTVITDLDTCLRLSYFNTFQLAQDTFIYGWLSYDSFARGALFGRCQVESSGFSLNETSYDAAFQFDFPNL